jgi:regulator of sigma E protease
MEALSFLHLPVTTLIFYALPFIAALTVIVFVHEYGHYIVARWCGVKIEAFSIGFGKEITGWNDRAGTRWKICWIPLGGYVRFEGDANAASLPDAAARRPGSFHGKPLWQRTGVVLAGPVANFILAIAIFAGAYAAVGVPYLPAKVADLVENGAAEKAGVKVGDVVVAIDGRPMKSFQDLQEAVMFRAGELLHIDIDRDGARLAFAIVPHERLESDGYGRVTKMALIGIVAPGREAMLVERLPAGQALLKGIERAEHVVTTTFKYLARVVVGKENGSQIGGAISIAWVMGNAASSGLFDFILTIGLISAVIGLINLFPIPMLDGGHLLFYGIEALLGRPLGPNAQEWGFRIGFSVVLMLMVVGLVNDIGWITK